MTIILLDGEAGTGSPERGEVSVRFLEEGEFERTRKALDSMSLNLSWEVGRTIGRVYASHGPEGPSDRWVVYVKNPVR